MSATSISVVSCTGSSKSTHLRNSVARGSTPRHRRVRSRLHHRPQYERRGHRQMSADQLAISDETIAPIRETDDIRDALLGMWPHFLWAGLFSSGINLLYLSSPLYLM